MSMTITETKEGSITVLNVSGFIDTSTSTQVEEALKKLFSENKMKVVFELSKTEFVSSAGWGVFVAYLRKARGAGGDIKLAGMADKVSKVFTLMEFDSLIDSYPTLQEALKGF